MHNLATGHLDSILREYPKMTHEFVFLCTQHRNKELKFVFCANSTDITRLSLELQTKKVMLMA